MARSVKWRVEGRNKESFYGSVSRCVGRRPLRNKSSRHPPPLCCYAEAKISTCIKINWNLGDMAAICLKERKKLVNWTFVSSAVLRLVSPVGQLTHDPPSSLISWTQSNRGGPLTQQSTNLLLNIQFKLRLVKIYAEPDFWPWVICFTSIDYTARMTWLARPNRERGERNRHGFIRRQGLLCFSAIWTSR